MFRPYLIIADEGMSGYFLAHLHRKYKEYIDEPNRSLLNEYNYYPSKLSHRLHGHEILGEHIDQNSTIHDGQIDITDSRVTWVFVNDRELMYKLLYLAQTKHQNRETEDIIKSKLSVRYKRHIGAYDRHKHLPKEIFNLDYKKFFIDADEQYIKDWCSFNDIEYVQSIRDEIVQYTQRNIEILEKHNVQI